MTDGVDSTGSDDAGSADAADTDALWKPGSPDSAVASTVGRVEDESAVRTDGESAVPTDDNVVDVGPSGSPWSSDSDAVFAATSATVFDEPGALTTEVGGRAAASASSTPRVAVDGEVISLPPRRIGRSRWIAVALVAALAVAAALVVRSVLTDELTATGVTELSVTGAVDAAGVSGAVAPLVTEPFPGADPRRLPAQLDQQWRVDVAGVAATSRTRLSVFGDDVVIGVFDADSIDAAADDGQAASIVIALDAEDGSERWRTPFDSQARAFEVLGKFGDVIVLERLDTENRAVLGISARTGEVAWERQTNDPGVHIALEGTGLVARVSFTVNARLTFIDPASGEEVGRVPGRLFATDYLGTWYVRNASAVSKLDLRDGWNPPTPYATLWVGDNQPATVVGDRVVAIDNGTLEVLGEDGAPDSVATLGIGSGGVAGLDTDWSFMQLSPMVEDAFILVGGRSVFGAQFDENGDADVRWRASGTPIGLLPTDRGLSIILATDGGGSQHVIDASTGSEVTAVEMVQGSIQTLQLVGNGVVVKQSALVGFERVGLDLDGNRLWSLVGDGPLAIGAGVVVTYGPSDAGVAITAYGDPA